MIKIAITSQNKTSITGHAGKCRNFWIYQIKENLVIGKDLIELDRTQIFSSFPDDKSHPLDTVNILITASIGQRLRDRLKNKGIQAIITMETTPDTAIDWIQKGIPINHLTHTLNC